MKLLPRDPLIENVTDTLKTFYECNIACFITSDALSNFDYIKNYLSGDEHTIVTPHGIYIFRMVFSNPGHSRAMSLKTQLKYWSSEIVSFDSLSTLGDVRYIKHRAAMFGTYPATAEKQREQFIADFMERTKNLMTAGYMD